MDKPSRASSWGRWMVSAILVTLLIIPFLAGGVAPSPQGALVVLTPHNEHIRFEVGEAFREWHREKFGTPTEIDWRNTGGSSDIIRLLGSLYEALGREGKEDQGSGYDVVFGGGDYLFDRRLKVGVTVTTNGGEKKKIPITQATQLDPGFVSSVFPSPMIADRRLYDADGHWWGVVISSFGIVYNTDLVQLERLPVPATWSDLADPKYFGWVGMVDPSHSGSIRSTYEAIVQRYGFEKGWRTLREVSANARYFASESSQIPVDVASGEIVAGLCVDHYALQQATVVGRGRLEYVAPIESTVVNADPVAVLRGSKHGELAKRFIEFLLSTEGQEVFCRKVGEPNGPKRFELLRPPIRRDMYDERLSVSKKDNLFESAQPLPAGTPSYNDVLPTVLHAMVIDSHDELVRAWSAIIRETDEAKKAKMLALFHELPFTQDELLAAGKKWLTDRVTATNDRIAWTKFFLDRYERVADFRE